MRISSHAVCLVEPKVDQVGTVVFHMSEYYFRKGRFSNRHVVETGENGERVSETIRRAIGDEIAENNGEDGNSSFELLEERPFHIVFHPDERNPGGMHAKFCFFIRFDGKRRSVAKQDGQEELGPMVEIEAKALLGKMQDSTGRILTVPFHLDVTKAALAALANKHAEVYYRYSSLLDSLEPSELTDEEWEAVFAYSKWF